MLYVLKGSVYVLKRVCVNYNKVFDGLATVCVCPVSAGSNIYRARGVK